MGLSKRYLDTKADPRPLTGQSEVDHMAASLAQFRRQRAEALRGVAEAQIPAIVELTGAEAVLLIGSVARGDANQSSDIDMIVVGASELTFKQRMNLLYTELAFDHQTDVFWYTTGEINGMLDQGNSFLCNAMESALVLYGAFNGIS